MRWWWTKNRLLREHREQALEIQARQLAKERDELTAELAEERGRALLDQQLAKVAMETVRAELRGQEEAARAQEERLRELERRLESPESYRCPSSQCGSSDVIRMSVISRLAPGRPWEAVEIGSTVVCPRCGKLYCVTNEGIYYPSAPSGALTKDAASPPADRRLNERLAQMDDMRSQRARP